MREVSWTVVYSRMSARAFVADQGEDSGSVWFIVINFSYFILVSKMLNMEINITFCFSYLQLME